MTAPLLTVQNLYKQFALQKISYEALHDVSFELHKGEILGIAGESGCGKSTLAKLLLRMLHPTSGHIKFENQDISLLKGNQLKNWRREAQMIFQQPADSLNPRMTILNILLEPFQIHKIGNGVEQKKKCEELLDWVALPKTVLKQTPGQLSGGQKQRIAIARALSLKPKLLVCDEPFSALDASTQGQILELLKQLHKEIQFACIVISHDLPVLRTLAHHMAIMQAGRLVEFAPVEMVFQKPQHSYTKFLLTSCNEFY